VFLRESIAANSRGGKFLFRLRQNNILEATERFSDRDRFVKSLEGLGFEVVKVEDKWKFTHIRALKTDRRLNEGVELRF
jgi:hypothetical protein